MKKITADVAAIPLKWSNKPQPPTMLVAILRGTAQVGSLAKQFPVLKSAGGQAAFALRIVDTSWRQLIAKVGEGSPTWTGGAQQLRLERLEEIARTLENAQVQTFVELAIAKDRKWAFTGNFKLELSPRGILSKSAAVSFDKGPFKVGAEYKDDGTKKFLVTVDVPLGDRTVRGKKCLVQELALWWDAECLREVRTRYPIPFPSFIEKKETLYLYFEYGNGVRPSNW